MNLFSLVAIAVASGVAFNLWSRHAAMRREAFIRSAELPKGLYAKVKEKYPHLSQKECELVAQGLRRFFLAHLKSGRKFLAMPSRLLTRFGTSSFSTQKATSFIADRPSGGSCATHPPPCSPTTAKRTLACAAAGGSFAKKRTPTPKSAARFPLMFALDGKLNIADGFRCVPDFQCVRQQDATGVSSSAAYSGANFSNTAYDGGTNDFGDGGGSDGSGFASGGNDGYGGGCGGGGD